jgi:precorrin-4/cobalt-precorrin-4 C11-methyltransferase
VTKPAPAVHIIGIGPGGDDQYLTAAALRALQQADLVIFPGTQVGESIRSHVRGELRWGRWFDDAQIHSWVRSGAAAGQCIAWLCAGDPTMYSGEPQHFSSLSSTSAWLRHEGLSFEIHPGVSSLQALLARLGLEHAQPESGCPMAVYAPARDPEPLARQRLESLAALGIPLALFLADEFLAQVVEIGLKHYGPDGRVVIGHRIGWCDERIIDSTLGQVLGLTDGGKLPRHTLLLVGPWHG